MVGRLTTGPWPMKGWLPTKGLWRVAAGLGSIPRGLMEEGVLDGVVAPVPIGVVTAGVDDGRRISRGIPRRGSSS